MGLYTGGLIFGGAYIRNGVNVSNLMGLYSGRLIFGSLRYTQKIKLHSLFFNKLFGKINRPNIFSKHCIF